MYKNYEILNNGVIHQKKIFNQIKKYDVEYVNNRYNSYGVKGHQISGLRLGFLISSIGRFPKSILDVGYGNGDFLSLCSNYIENCYGNDISDYPLPDNVKFTKNIADEFYDVICFFDVLEHFESIDFVKNLNCNYIFISVPWCHFFNEEWFMNWKHRRPDEHLWHFDDKSIVNFFNENNFELVAINNIEDVVRKSEYDYENILTCIFKKIKKC
jgi:hypothetical protein